jgi:hypothetical protein
VCDIRLRKRNSAIDEDAETLRPLPSPTLDYDVIEPSEEEISRTIESKRKQVSIALARDERLDQPTIVVINELRWPNVVGRLGWRAKNAVRGRERLSGGGDRATIIMDRQEAERRDRHGRMFASGLEGQIPALSRKPSLRESGARRTNRKRTSDGLVEHLWRYAGKKREGAISALPQKLSSTGETNAKEAPVRGARH